MNTTDGELQASTSRPRDRLLLVAFLVTHGALGTLSREALRSFSRHVEGCYRCAVRTVLRWTMVALDRQDKLAVMVFLRVLCPLYRPSASLARIHVGVAFGRTEISTESSMQLHASMQFQMAVGHLSHELSSRSECAS